LAGEDSTGGSVALVAAFAELASALCFEEASIPRSLAWAAAAVDWELPGAGGGVGVAGLAGVGVGFAGGLASGTGVGDGAGLAEGTGGDSEVGASKDSLSEVPPPGSGDEDGGDAIPPCSAGERVRLAPSAAESPAGRLSPTGVLEVAGLA